MKSASQIREDIDNLAYRFEMVDWYSMFELDSSASALLLEAEPLMVEMAMLLHRSFEYIYDNYEEALALRLDSGKLADKGSSSRGSGLNTRFQCVLLSYEDEDAEIDDFHSQIARDTSPSGMAISCIYSVLRGDFVYAIQSYHKALELLNTGADQQGVNGLPALFCALALLKTKNAADATPALDEFLQVYTSAFPNDRFVAVVEILKQYAVTVAGKASVNQPSLFDDSAPISCPWQVLFRCVCLHWLQLNPSSKLLTQLKKFANKAASAGVFWYFSQASNLLHSFGSNASNLGFDKGVGWLLDFKQPAKGWAAQLQKIETISARYTKRTGLTESDQRIVWLCSRYGQTIEVSPRVQKLTKKGVWTKGRKISIDEILWGHQDFDYLTSEDRKYCDALRRDTSDRYRYSFNQSSFTVNEVGQLEALATLGKLYRCDNFDSKSMVPMSIELQEPHLEVLQQPGEDDILIQLKPEYSAYGIDAIEDPYLWRMHWVTDDKLLVTIYTEGQLEIANVLGSEGLPVPVDSKDRVLNALQMMAPLITVLSDIGGEAMPDLLEVEPDSTPHMELSPLQEGLRAELKIYPFGSDGPSVVPGQSGPTMVATIEDEPRITNRDIALELQRIEKLVQAAPLVELYESDTKYRWDIDDPAHSLELLDTLQEFANEIIVEWPRGKKISTPNRVSSSNMSVNVGGSQDWLKVDGELQISEDRVLQMDTLLRLMDNSQGRFVKLDDGSILALSKRLQSQLIALRGVSDKGRAHPLASAVIDESTADMNVTGSDDWQQRLERLREAASLELPLPVGLNAQLRDYQVEGFQWLGRLAHWGGGACLADDMGLGKTLQSLAIVLHRTSLGPTLVVAPTSVCSNWEDEIARFAKSLNVLRLDKSDRDRQIKNCTAGDVLICSYGLLQNEIEKLVDVQWATVVADEAQAFKNSQTRRSKAMMLLKADFRLITTGTPIENHLGELWNLFRFINPGLLGSRERFNARFAQPIEVRGEEPARLQLKAMVRPFILRRLKRDVLTELPPRTEITQLIEFTPQEAAFYEAIRRQSLERIGNAGVEVDQRFQILAEITRLRQVCCNPQLVVDNPPVESAKLRAFGGIVDELRENGHRCLVFSQFVGHLKLIREYLNTKGIHYQYLDGSTSVNKRKKAVDDFQGGDGELFLISLKAGGSGLNLTAADYVIHMDPWWNPAVEDQASDRAHRMGQTRPVTIYRLVMKDTIEEKIVALHSQKRDLADGLLEGTDSGVRLSVDDLMQLLNLESHG